MCTERKAAASEHGARNLAITNLMRYHYNFVCNEQAVDPVGLAYYALVFSTSKRCRAKNAFFDINFLRKKANNMDSLVYAIRR